MKTLSYVPVLLGLCSALVACNDFEEEGALKFGSVEPDSTWRRIDARGAFSFLLPARLQAKDVQGIDSYVGAYEDSTLRLHFDYGWYSGYPHEHGQPGYTKKDREINGHRAILVSYRLEIENTARREGFEYFTSVYFPVDKEEEDGDEVVADTTNELSMDAICKTTRDCAVAHGIFESIRFPE